MNALRGAVLAVLALSACPQSPASDAGSGGGSAGNGGGAALGGGSATGGGSAMGGGTGTGGGTGGIPAPAFCAQAASAQCDWLLSCGRILQNERTLCVAELQPLCDREMHTALHGGPGYDPVAAWQCIASIPSNPCFFYYLNFGAGCGHLPITTIAGLDAGQPCSDDPIEGFCAAGYCLNAGATACGVCTPFAAAGLDQPCDSLAHRCVDGTFCSHPDDGGVDRCAPTQPDGTPPLNGNAGCNGSIASYGADGGLICGYLAPGAPCDPASDGCDLTHACNATSATCVARTPVGQPCTNQPYDDGCAFGATCLDGVCQVAPYASRDAGTECEAFYQCAGEQRCVFDGGTEPLRAGVCAPRLPANAACTGNSDCVTSTSCLMGQCTPLGAIGDRCLGFQSCRPVYVCLPATDGGPSRCVAPPVLGERCLPGDRCLNADGGSAACTSDGGRQVFTCTLPLPVGSPCGGAYECDSRRCENDAGTGAYVCEPSCWP